MISPRLFFANFLFVLVTLFPVLSVASETRPSDSPLVIELSAWRYTADKKAPVAVSRAKPGDTLSYQVRYFNQSKTALSDVWATLPIPESLLLVGTESLTGLFASTDGEHFSPWPLREKISMAGGRVIEQPVPLSKVRMLRWLIPVLKPGVEAIFTADVQVKK